MNKMQNGVVHHNNGQLIYETNGSGEPIIFVHGFGLDRTMWRPQVEFFARKYQVVTYDVRGFGESSLPDRPYSHAADLKALIDHLGLKGAHIVGLSMGGRIAINFALTYPGMVRSLTLMDTALDGYASDVDWNVHAKIQGIEKAKQNWLQHDLFATVREQAHLTDSLQVIIDRYSGWHWLNNDIYAAVSTDACNRLDEIRVPTLILVGQHDLSYFCRIADLLSDRIAKAQKIVVPNVGHMINLEAPSEVNRHVAEFFE